VFPKNMTVQVQTLLPVNKSFEPSAAPLYNMKSRISGQPQPLTAYAS
jgi:hypothetical protein